MNPTLSHTSVRATFGGLLIALIAMMIMLFSPDGAAAAPVKLSADPVPGTGDAVVKVAAPRHAKAVSLYVDGHLAQHDSKWPWKFGKHGKIAVGDGRHKVKVLARLDRHHDIERTVTVSTHGNTSGSGSGSSGTGSKSSSGSGSGETPTTTKPSKSTKPTPTAPSTPAPAPEPPATTTSPAASGSILFNGTYDNGNVNNWDLVQQAAPGRISVVGSPTEPSNDVGRFEVRPTDSIGDTSPRAEVGKYLGDQEGEESWYRWYTYFPENFPTNYPNQFITFTQWRAVDESEDYTSFMLWGENLELRREGTKWSTKLVKNMWHKFVYHVKWSPDPTVGFIELFYDGQLVLPKTFVRTMGGTVANPVENYVKQGLYKSEEIPTGVLYQDGFVAGTSFEAVNNAPS